MASFEREEANELRSKADKKLKGFNLFGSRARRLEEAAELYERAAAKYRVSKHWEDAAEAHMMAAHNYQSSDSENWVDARKNFEEAAKAFRKCNPEASIPAYRAAADISMRENSFSLAAKLFRSMGEVMEEEQMDISDAIFAYKQAADCFESEDAIRNQNEMLLKVAFLSAKQELYTDAVELYDKVARSTKNGAQKSIVEMCMVNATACRLAAPSFSTEDAEAKFEEYKDICSTLETSRAGQMIEGLFESLRQADLDKWDEAIADYSNKEVLSEFMSSLFAQAKDRRLTSAVLGDNFDLT